MTEEEKKLEILVTMEESVLSATKLARMYDFAFDLKSSVVFVMNLYKEFHGKKHKTAHQYGL